MTRWSDLPQSERDRLIARERAQRTETKARGLPVLPCDPEALWMLQRGMCTCPECKGEQPLVAGQVVIAHVFFRAGKGSPGHVPHNVALWNDGCNRREAGPETTAAAKGKRFEVRKPEPEERTRAKAEGRHRPIRSAGFSGSRKFNGEVTWKTK